jgi:hypothetical protein
LKRSGKEEITPRKGDAEPYNVKEGSNFVGAKVQKKEEGACRTLCQTAYDLYYTEELNQE